MPPDPVIQKLQPGTEVMLYDLEKEYITRIAKIANDLDKDFLRCRVMKHVWDDRYGRELTEEDRFPEGFFQIIVCVRCKLEVHIWFDRLMRVLLKRGHYPKGYSIGGQGRVTARFNAGVRLAAKDRLWNFDAKDDT